MGGYTRELDDGTVIYSASSLGNCPAALYYDRLGVTHEPPPENIRKAWQQGHDNEAGILTLLESQKVWRVLDNQRCKEAGFVFGEYDATRNQDYSSQVRADKKVGLGVITRAHCDSVLECNVVPGGWKDTGLTEGCLVIGEAKAFGDGYWKRFQAGGLAAFPGYQWQATVQMMGLGLPLLFVVGHKNKDGKVFEVDSELVMTPPVSWGKIVAKITMVEKAVDKKEPPKCVDPYDYPCPFYTRHDDGKDMFGVGGGGDNDIDAIKVGGQLAKTIDILSERYLKHKELAKTHKDESEAAKSALMGYFKMDDEDNDGAAPSPLLPIDADRFRVVPKPGSKKGGLDEKKMTEDGIDVEKYRKPKSVWMGLDVERK